MEFSKVYRPHALDEVIGQEHVTVPLAHMAQNNAIPHCLLMSGPSGTGKTSTARILASFLNCTGQDLQEKNCADDTGIDDIRAIGLQLQTRSLVKNGNKMFLMDECHLLSSQAQSGLLKMTEDTPPHVYMVFVTTHPHKLLPTLLNRATHFVFKSIPDHEIEKQLLSVCAAENLQSLSAKVLSSIVENAKGSMRAALVLLEQIAGIKGEQAKLNALVASGSDSEREGIEIARLLYKGGSWKPVADAIRGCSLEPETVRRIVLGYASAILQNGKFDQRALFMIEAFQFNFYDSGKAGLLLAAGKLTK